MRIRELDKTLIFIGLFLMVVPVFPGVENVQAASGSFTEDFSGTTHMDVSETSTTGWGGGSVSNPFQKPKWIARVDTDGYANNFRIAGDVLYVCDGSTGIKTYDISDVSSPTLLDSYATTNARDIGIHGNYAFVGDGTGGFKVFNIIDPSNLVYVTAYNGPGSEADVWIEGNYAYVSASTYGVRVIDISNPASPSYVTAAFVSNYHHSTEPVVEGNLLFVPQGLDKGLTIFDISNPSSPVKLSEYNTAGTSEITQSVAVSGDYAYVAEDNTGLVILDISNPSSPSLEASLAISGNVYDVAVDGSYVFIANYGKLSPYVPKSIQVVDATDPSNPVLQCTYEIGATSSKEILLHGKYCFVAQETYGFEIYELYDYSTPSWVGEEDTRNLGTITVDWPYAYTIQTTTGFYVYDISNPLSPVEIGSIGSLFGWNIDVQGNYAYVSGHTDGVRVVNITDPSNPVIVSTYGTPTAYGVAVDGDYCYVGAGSSGLVVLNVQNPASPSFAGGGGVTGLSHGTLFVDGDYVYVCDGNINVGFRIYDISNPASPSYKSYYRPGTYCVDVVVSGDTAYLLTDLALFVLDVSNPSSISVLGSCSTPTQGKQLILDGDRVYVADADNIVRIIDVSNPNSPVQVDSYTFSYYGAYDIELAGDYMYVAQSIGGLQVIKVKSSYTELYEYECQAQSTAVFTSSISAPVERATLSVSYSAPSGTYIDYYLSADGGTHWEASYPNVQKTFSYSGNILKWKAILRSSSSMLTSPVINSLSISYYYYFIAPTLVSPISGTYLNDATPTLSWGSVTDATEYRIQIDTSSSFNTGNLRIETETSTSHTPTVPLFDGTWYWRVAAVSAGGDVGKYSSSRTVIVETTLPTIDNPEDQVVEYGSTNTKVTWTPFDANPSHYNVVHSNGTVIISQPWSGSPVTLSLDGWDIGSYEIICSVSDIADRWVSDTVNVTVEDTTPPAITPFGSYSYIEGTSDHVIEWEVFDYNPYWFNITFEGIEIDSGPWVGGNIATDIGGLSRGTWTYNLRVSDLYGNFANDMVVVTVNDTTEPVVDQSPDDKNIVEGTSNNNVTWTMVDSNPFSYNISIDSDVVLTMDWDGGVITYNLDHLTRGAYNITCTVTDLDGNSVNDTVVITVTDQTVPTITSPRDITYPEGTEYVTLEWIGLDMHPENFTVKIDGTDYLAGFWVSNITVDVGGLAYGSHTVTCLVSDVDEHVVSDTVNVHVYDDLAPVIDNPVDLTFTEGTTGHGITWNPADEHPSQYNITLDGSLFAEGPWDGGAITVSVDSIPHGIHVITCHVYDLDGNHIEDAVTITVQDITPPVIDHPDDIEYSEGETGNQITWNPVESHPDSYTILRNGMEVESGEWDGSPISINVDGLEAGSYTYQLTVYDNSGYSASDNVVVNVLQSETTTPEQNQSTSTEQGNSSSQETSTDQETSLPVETPLKSGTNLFLPLTILSLGVIGVFRKRK
ncbi:MAG: hypothetical protein ACFFD4_10515 [Candidatus Odinarchaeota archaeon]